MEEPNAALRWAMLHFAGGDAFLVGLSVFALGQIVLLWRGGPAAPPPSAEPRAASRTLPWRRYLTLATSGGLFWAIIDPPPVPWSLTAGFTLLLVAGTVSRWLARRAVPGTSRVLSMERLFRGGLVGCALMAIAHEAGHGVFLRPAMTVRTLSVVGDSVTAGLNDGEETWPKLLSRRVDAVLLDASQPGATLKSALRQVELLNEFDADVLILEIGGNDLLEGLPVEDFEKHLDQLLNASQKPGRAIVQFELPLPPLAVRYCEVQRRLAARYHVSLIPRRQFLRVLTGAGGTVDGIHLSERGQSRLADLVEGLLTFDGGGTGRYRRLERTR